MNGPHIIGIASDPIFDHDGYQFGMPNQNNMDAQSKEKDGEVLVLNYNKFVLYAQILHLERIRWGKHRLDCQYYDLFVRKCIKT